MTRRNSLFVPMIIFLILALIGILAVGLYWQVENLRQWVTSEFGSPATTLNRTDQIVYAYKLFVNLDNLKKPIKENGTDQNFNVKMGESILSISDRLEKEGLIRNGEAFRDYLIYSGLDTLIQAGKYKLNPGLSAVDIAQRLLDSTPKDVAFRIIPGWRIEEIADTLETSGLNIDRDEFIDTTKKAELLPTVQDGELKNLEGFLFPDVYEIEREVTAEELIEIFLERFEENVTEEMMDGFFGQNLSLYDAVKLASLVEKEAVIEEEKPIIASVFLNRLAEGMKLDSDPTIQYALGYQETTGQWWKVPLDYDDLEYDSPYNTYKTPGLPPVPICNPGLSSLKAIANPAKTKFLFFQAKCDGSGYHNFTITFEEHLENLCP